MLLDNRRREDANVDGRIRPMILPAGAFMVLANFWVSLGVGVSILYRSL